MPDIRETYELPERPPVPYRIWVLTIVVPALALGLWLLLPDGATAEHDAARLLTAPRQTATAAGPSTCSSSARSVGVGATR
jgi:hypothetical protein